MNKIEIAQQAIEGKIAIETADAVRRSEGFMEKGLTQRKMVYALELGMSLPAAERLIKKYNIEF